ncbi:P1 family peptidase [Candidatus Contubernalis alkaliaceticus]|uniref:P1 family peptidase n=1 Tax=Candidatus Contubernalis alkaliaceticus TaxID=338645 RepID=UPI001F4BDE21|nr:P1 family peptidase [Candidatus Contubernalis alkalaceticus]UNC91926.1 P1 family peptidase [Candidatus Contubernalis alkalaceticus]
MSGGLTEIPGIKVGVCHDRDAATGVTVILVEEGAGAGVEVRGSAPGTRETDLLQPGRLVEEVQALVLAGGSIYGLDAASGVVRYLEEGGFGYSISPLKIPIVPAAILFDLFIGSSSVRPDAQMGYQACLNASSGPVPEGSVGAGTGATVGKFYGPLQAVKSGQGSASRHRGKVVTAALVVVNALGDVYDSSGLLLAGPRNPETGVMEKTIDLFFGGNPQGFSGNTTLGVVATNAKLSKEALGKVAQMAHDGLARSIWPVHTMWDGDTIFSLSAGEEEADPNLVGIMAAEALAEASARAVLKAQSLAGIPCRAELLK